MTKVAVIGAGYWGKNLIRNFAELGALAAVSDTNQDAANALASHHNVPAKSWTDIINDSSIDAVAIVTPAIYHFDLVTQALSKNKHVFVEKPITLNAHEANELHKLAHKHNKVLMVGHLLHYHPVFDKLKKMVHTGEFGKLQYIQANRLSFGKVYAHKDVVWNLAPHDVSMILSLTQSQPLSASIFESMHPTRKHADAATLHLTFEDNIRASVYVSWINPTKEHKFTVIGDKATAVFNDGELDWDKKLSVYKYSITPATPNPITEISDVEYVRVPKSEPLKNECMHFIDCIKNNKQPITNGLEAYNVTEAIERSKAHKL